MQLNRTTLLRQGLLKPLNLGPVAAVAALGPLQAQDPAGVWLALSARLADFSPVALDRAFETGTLVRAQLLRITLHALGADDYPTFWSAMAPSLRTVLRRPSSRSVTSPGAPTRSVLSWRQKRAPTTPGCGGP